LQNKLIKGILSVLSGSIIILVINIIYNPILIRLVDKLMYGEIASLLAFYTLISVFSVLGMFDAIRKYISSNINDREKLSNGITVSLILPVFIGLFICIIFILFFKVLSGYNIISGINFTGYLILLLSLIPQNIWTSSKAILFSFHQEGMGTRLNIILFVLHKIFVVLWLLNSKNILVIPVSFLFSNTMGALIGLRMLRKCLRLEKIHLRFNNIITKLLNSYNDLIKFGLMSTLGIFSAQLLYKGDIILINYFTGPEKTAIYKVGLVLAEMLWLVPKAIQSILFHNSSELWGQNNVKGLSKLGNQLLLYNTLVLILLGTGLFVLAEPFIDFYFGKGFGESVFPLKILIIGTVFFGIARIIASILKATEWIKIVETVTFITASANIILNIILIPRLGINGAAIATSFTYALILFGNLMVLKVYKINLQFSFPTIRIIILSVLFYLGYSFICRLFEVNDIIDIVFTAIIGIFLFIILCIGLKLLNVSHLKKYISSFLKGV